MRLSNESYFSCILCSFRMRPAVENTRSDEVSVAGIANITQATETSLGHIWLLELQKWRTFSDTSGHSMYISTSSWLVAAGDTWYRSPKKELVSAAVVSNLAFLAGGQSESATEVTAPFTDDFVSYNNNNNNNNTQICKAHIVGWWNPNLRRHKSSLSKRSLL